MKFTDQMGEEINLAHTPTKIVSLVPSQSELLFYLGLDKEIIGISKFCIHPKDKFLSTQKIGGTKTIDIEKIKALKPDLIIGNKEENEELQIKELKKYFPVWMSDIVHLEDNNSMILKVGELVNKKVEAEKLVNEIRIEWEDLKNKFAFNNPRVAYFIWYNPLMLVGKNTFIDSVLKYLGFENVVLKERYPIMNFEELRKMKLNFVFLSSEPFPFKDKHLMEFRKALPGVEVIIVDGEMFSWYGSRMKMAAKYFFTFLK